MTKIWASGGLMLLMAGCAAVPAASPATSAGVPGVSTANVLSDTIGLEAVFGRDAQALTRLFGEPRLDVVEPVGRKLQFVGPPCILDTYLYADQPDGREVVTHVDARRRDGAAVDRAACVAALQAK